MAALFLFCCVSATAATKPYHLQVEAQPAAVFPYLAKFGTIDIDVYPSGVRADTIWLDAFSRNGANTITVENPLARMYTDVPVAQISSLLRKLGTIGSVEQQAAPAKVVSSKGTIGNLAATRYRLEYGPAAWIDVWTTTAIPENPQFKRIVNELVTAISPATGTAVRAIPGTPIFVELNFRRFKKVPLVRFRKLSLDASGEKGALNVGSFYLKAPLLDSLWR